MVKIHKLAEEQKIENVTTTERQVNIIRTNYISTNINI